MTQPKIPKIKMPGMSNLQMKNPIQNVTLNPEAFEEFIKSQGVRMIHSRPLPCPNVRDLYQPDHPLHCNICFNGYLYYDKSEFIGALSNNTFDRQFSRSGAWDFDQAGIIIPVKDQDGNILDMQYFDQIELPDFTVRYYQRIEHNQSGVDRAQFRVATIDALIANSGKRYRPGVDFIVDDGRIKWIGERPGYDSTLKRGEIYSVNYYTKPVFSVVNMPHQLRIAQTQSDAGPGSNNIPSRFPQLIVVRKDFIPFDEADNIGRPDRPEPNDGSFGPGPHIRPDKINEQFGL